MRDRGGSFGPADCQRNRLSLSRPSNPPDETRIAGAWESCLCLSSTAYAQPQASIAFTRAAEPPKIDGVLDDAAWAQLAPMPTGQWVSYNPNRGDDMPDVYKTDVRIAYDDRNIYFAFHCFDNEPAKIRTNVAKRDASFSDDWIALSLDSAGTGQAAYHLFSNPSASQMDALNTSASGEQFDADMVWFSGAKTTADGYVVEVQIPLQTLRFSGGDEVKMNLVFFRKVSRIGYSVRVAGDVAGAVGLRSPVATRLQQSQAAPPRRAAAEHDLRHQPAARDARSSWTPADDKYNIGASGKIGITSGITLDGTINPDFSQVESDAFQVQVNQRFPVFFSEKRPFFMEGMGLFNIAGTGGDGNMRTAVHTRRIVDPIYGSKLTGTIGKTAFGVLNAVDDSPTPPFTIEGEPIDVANKVTTVGPRFVRAAAIGLCRRHLHAHACTTAATTSSPAAISPCGRPTAHSLSATFLTSRTTDRENRRSQRQYCTGELHVCHAPLVQHQSGRALRRRLRDGHGVLQPHRLHRRVVVQRGELLSASHRGSSASTRSTSRSTAAIASRTAMRISCTPASASTSRARASSTSRTAAATNRGRARSTGSAATSTSSATCRRCAG